MHEIKKRVTEALVWARRHWFIIFVVVSYFVSTMYYMGPAALHCSTFVNGFGDSTGGPIWRYALDDSRPIPGFQTNTNYPFGEDLSTPLYATFIGQTMLIWGASKVVGPVCGYNVVNMLGYLSTALIMFAFVYHLLKKRYRWIAWLAGYAVAFTPYIQIKTGVHPGYAFGGLLILALWMCLNFIRKRTKGNAVALIVSVAACFYFDPYFSLLVTTLLLPFVVVYVAKAAFDGGTLAGRKERVACFFKSLRPIALVAIGVFVLLLPLLLTIFSSRERIAADVSGTRDNMQSFAYDCSNWVHEYFLPYPNSPLLHLLGESEQKIRSTLYEVADCGLAEDAVGIPIIIWAVVILGLIVLLWERMMKRPTKFSTVVVYPPAYVIGAFVLALLLAIGLGLPPFQIAGIPSPSQFLISVTSNWRVVAREYMVVNIVVISLASVLLAYFHSRIKPRWIVSALVMVGSFLVIFAMYQTHNPLYRNSDSYFDYTKLAPAYSWLRNQSSIHDIVEYPIGKAAESSAEGYYLTMQSVHKKALFNSVVGASDQDLIRSSIRSLADPQSVRVLASLGIDAVVVHGVSEEVVASIPGLRVLYVSSDAPGHPFTDTRENTIDRIVIAKILPQPKNDWSIQFLDKVYANHHIQKSAVEWDYEVLSGTRIGLLPIDIRDKTVERGKESALCFRARMSVDQSTARLKALNSSGQEVVSLVLTDEYQDIKIPVVTGDYVTVSNSINTNIRMSRIGCQE